MRPACRCDVPAIFHAFIVVGVAEGKRNLELQAVLIDQFVKDTLKSLLNKRTCARAGVFSLVLTMTTTCNC